MFQFWKSKPKKQQPLLDQKLKKLLTQTQQSAQLSRLAPFYNMITQSIQNCDPVLIQKYRKQMQRIKKSQVYWNYTDIKIMYNCIKKSMQNQSLSYFIDKWCEHLDTYLLYPMLDVSTNYTASNLNAKKKRQIIAKQIELFCQYLFKFSFVMYQKFFYKYYKKSQSALTMQQIYEKQKGVFEDLIRNIITSTAQFQFIYKKSLLKLLNFDSFYTVNEEKIAQLNKFLKHQLHIQKQHSILYKHTIKKIWDFHTASNLQQKLVKMTEIVPAIEHDHNKYFKQIKIQMVNQQQTKTTELLMLLFAVICPEIYSSFNYIRLMLCYRSQIQNFQQMLSQFCLIWLNQAAESKILVVFDADTSST